MIKYKIQAKANPTNREEVKYYLQIAPTSVVTVESVIKRISNSTTVTSSDVRAVIDALEYEIIESLRHGDSIRLGHIGSFRPTIASEGTETVKEAKTRGANLIKKVNVIYTKSAEIENAMRIYNLEFAMAKDVVNASEDEEDEATTE